MAGSGFILTQSNSADVATPPVGKLAVFIDQADGYLAEKDDTGTVMTLKGAPGEGVPAGGTTGQILAKASGTDYDTDWIDPDTGGDFSGPGASTDNALVRFDGTTGKLGKNSGVLVTDNNEISGYRGNVNLQTGTTYTLLTSDTGRIIDHANGSGITVTLPNNLPVGFCCTYAQSGAGQVNFSAASGATLHNRQAHTKLAGQWAEGTLYVRANSGGSAAEYVLAGDTSS